MWRERTVFIFIKDLKQTLGKGFIFSAQGGLKFIQFYCVVVLHGTANRLEMLE